LSFALHGHKSLKIQRKRKTIIAAKGDEVHRDIKGESLTEIAVSAAGQTDRKAMVGY
jgi:hypothetical protein